MVGRSTSWAVELGNSQTGSSSYYDRGIYIRSDGRVSMGVVTGFDGYTPIPAIVTSPQAYNDGTWHLATGTFGDGSVRLYVDGVQVDAVAASTGWTYDGWWRWGWDNLSGVPSAPSDPSFIGSMAHAAVFSRALTAAEVSAQYGSGT